MKKQFYDYSLADIVKKMIATIVAVATELIQTRRLTITEDKLIYIGIFLILLSFIV